MTAPQEQPSGPQPWSTELHVALFLVALGIVLACATAVLILPNISRPWSGDRSGSSSEVEPVSAQRPMAGDCVTAAVGAEDPKVVDCDDPYASFKVLAVISYADIDKAAPDPCLQ
jgi:hypothetical protein